MIIFLFVILVKCFTSISDTFSVDSNKSKSDFFVEKNSCSLKNVLFFFLFRYGLKRETAPFVLTKDFEHVIVHGCRSDAERVDRWRQVNRISIFVWFSNFLSIFSIVCWVGYKCIRCASTVCWRILKHVFKHETCWSCAIIDFRRCWIHAQCIVFQWWINRSCMVRVNYFYCSSIIASLAHCRAQLVSRSLDAKRTVIDNMLHIAVRHGVVSTSPSRSTVQVW